MIKLLKKLNYKTKYELQEQSEALLNGWGENGNPEVVWDGCRHECQLNNEDESVLVLYRCECGEYIADYDDYSGRDEEVDSCPKCGRHYDA